MLLHLPDVHRTAHDNHEVEAVERRNLLTPLEVHRQPVVSGLGPEVPERTRMLNLNMLKNQEPHSTSLSFSPPRPGRDNLYFST